LSASQAPSSALKSHHLLSKAIISSEENHHVLWRKRGVEVRFRLVESASFKFFFFFFSGIDSRKRGGTKEKGERKVVRIPEIDSSTPKKEPNF
jgi:hypothetical protein